MGEEKNNVPKLRFKEFHSEWINFKLSDIVERVTRKNKDLVSKRPLTISAIDGLIDQEEYFNKIVASKNLKNYYLLNKGEFAYNKSYSNGYPYGTIKRLDFYKNGAVSTLYICFKPKNNVNSNFLKIYFETDKWYKEVYKIAIEGARNHGLLNISINDFFNTKHFLPSLNEQKKISAFIDILSTKINILKNEYKNYINLKQFLLQNMFPSNGELAPKLRFTKKNGENFERWNEVKLGDICSINKGKQLNKNDMISNGKYYVLNGGINPSGFTSEWNTYENTITISEGGNSCGYVNFNFEKFWSGGHCYSLGDLHENINTYFLFSNLKYHEKHIMVLRVGSSLPNIQKKDLKKFKIKIPTLEEQNKISSMFYYLDKKIDLIQNQIDKMGEFKKGLLQQMFEFMLFKELILKILICILNHILTKNKHKN